VSPTDNGVLNQIPAGDSRESSREQVVPGDGALVHRSLLMGRSQSDLPDPQKKKRKKDRGLEYDQRSGARCVEDAHRFSFLDREVAMLITCGDLGVQQQRVAGDK